MKLLNALYGIWVMLLFFVVLTLMLPFYILLLPFPDRTATLWRYKIHKFFFYTWGFLTGIRMQVENDEKRDPNQVYVITGNHCNMLDIPLTGCNIQHYFKPLVKKEIQYVPILGQLFALAAIPVDRSNPESRKKSMELMIRKLKQGMSIMIYPEGTRNRTDKPLKEFHSGAFRLAIQAQVPILPFVQLNLRHLQPVTTMRVYPGTITMKFLDPIPTAGLADTPEEVEKLKQLVFSVMEKEVITHEPMFQVRK